MASSPEMIAFPSRDAMAARLADLIETALIAGVAGDDRGEIAVSGGSTPKALYEALAGRDLPWRQIGVTLVDERWVAADHPRSNEAFVRAAFENANGARINGLYDGSASPIDAIDYIAERLAARTRRFDVVVLGMGDDGHTASWFPHAEGLSAALESDQPFCAVTAIKSDVTGDEIERVTATLSAIRNAKLVILMMAGEAKSATYAKALEDGPVDEMPVRAILRARPDMWVCWAP